MLYYDWSQRAANGAALENYLGNGFVFKGVGWYGEGDNAMLVTEEPETKVLTIFVWSGETVEQARARLLHVNQLPLHK